MADINHSALSDPYLHEPKGIASASDHQVYVSNGAGSGAWTTWPTGWGFYADNGAAQTFNTTAAKMLIDGAGATTETSYLPPAIRGTGQLWDTTNSKITPIANGDAYDVRLSLPVTGETGSPTEVQVELDIGGGATPSISILSVFRSTGRSTPYTVTVAFPIFSLSTFLSNGGQIFLTTDTGSVTVTNPTILITRTHGAAF